MSQAGSRDAEQLPREATQELGGRRRILFAWITAALSGLVILGAAEVIVRLAVSEETFWPVSNIYHQADVPGLVYTYRPDFNGTAFGVDLQTNSLGFRGPAWSLEKKPGVFRIVLIGDSHAFGFGVPFDETVGEILSRRLERDHGIPTEVLNLGVNGFNTLQQQAALESPGFAHSPDMVILLPANNDHKDVRKADADGWLHWDGRGENEKSRIVDRSIAALEVREVSWWMEKSRLYRYVQLIRSRERLAKEAQVQRPVGAGVSTEPGLRWMGEFPAAPTSERLEEAVYEPLVEMLDEIEARSLPVIVATFCGSTDYRQMFRQLEQDRGIILLELLALFPEAESWEEFTTQFGLGWNDHGNAVSHERWAVALAELIAENGFIPGAS